MFVDVGFDIAIIFDMLVCKHFVILFHNPFLQIVNLSSSVDTVSEVFQ